MTGLPSQVGSEPPLDNSGAGGRFGKAAKILFVAAVVNFAVWGMLNSYIRGDALNGTIRDGKYYVAAKGKYTEVSRRVYVYSYVHTVSQFVMFGAMFITGALEAFGRPKGK